jgi:GNAT superfamily N-acetyltransferase
MADDVTVERGDGPDLLGILDEVTDLYLAVRAELPDPDSALYSREAFTTRTTSQAGRDGFAAVWARTGGTLVGFGFGFRFGEGRWWSGNPTTPPAEILDATKFALIELNVAAAWRGRGIGRRMHDLLLENRPEPYAILTATHDDPARRMYERWGWEQIGTAQHTPDAPVMDQLLLRLVKS